MEYMNFFSEIENPNHLRLYLHQPLPVLKTLYHLEPPFLRGIRRCCNQNCAGLMKPLLVISIIDARFIAVISSVVTAFLS